MPAPDITPTSPASRLLRWTLGFAVLAGSVAATLVLVAADAPAAAKSAALPATQAALPADSHLDKTPPRKPTGLELPRNGWMYNCMECHTLLQARWHYDRPVNEHRDIKLEHGNNRFCLNCHHPSNRNAFVDYDGAEISRNDGVQLCAKCHGTIHRDWKAGVHGRQNGYWDASSGPKAKLQCIQCHDPHRPKFQPMKPLPPLLYPSRGANPPAADTAPAAHH